MTLFFFTGDPFGKCAGSLWSARSALVCLQVTHIVGFWQGQGNLAATNKFKVDAGQKFRVQQGAMFATLCDIDAVALAECIKAVRPHGMAFLGERQRIDYPLVENWRPFDKSQLGIQKTNIETGVVNDQDRLANECQKFIYDLGKYGFVFQKLAAYSMNGLGFARARRVAG